VSPRLKLLALGAVCIAPMILGTLAYHFGWFVSDKPGNYGELVEPRQLSGPPFTELRGKWVLVTFDTAACDAYCERKLYFMRQIRRAQGKEQNRIERLWVLTDQGTPRPEVLVAIEGSRVASASAWGGAFPHQGKLADHIYLVDPLGNLMMRYPKDPDPSKMLKDLQRLMRFSRIG
jgi:cytochrome oxidase Cu insertion factor (SCO1/SenC/PrrC family)